MNAANVRRRRVLAHLRTAGNNLATLHSSVTQVLRIIQKEERQKPYTLHVFSTMEPNVKLKKYITMLFRHQKLR